MVGRGAQNLVTAFWKKEESLGGKWMLSNEAAAVGSENRCPNNIYVSRSIVA